METFWRQVYFDQEQIVSFASSASFMSARVGVVRLVVRPSWCVKRTAPVRCLTSSDFSSTISASFALALRTSSRTNFSRCNR